MRDERTNSSLRDATAAPERKEKYEPPTLVEFGDVVRLTGQ